MSLVNIDDTVHSIKEINRAFIIADEREDEPVTGAGQRVQDTIQRAVQQVINKHKDDTQ